ncbi:AAA family ATPase [Candidatus Nomurabacteria bacterium]|nr:MAG: AAA family ATPase [Candidatus Nomurabacteria bacterium]
MYLKRIELTGFKSFAKKTVLEFSAPVTAIVGPNGSGKSNVVESLRFVLGEQSIKSMRGKSGTDLIFKGSKGLSAPNRASVEIVFDNTKKIFSFANKEGAPELLFDEVSISREVYSDGQNVYKINGTDVRLKDIVELLSSVHIGSSGHHMISQGEADRILNSSSKDRRAMIEDALGLKIYQYRIRESERKLERTSLNMKEIATLRREIGPHLHFLKKQVEKIEKAKEMRVELSGLYAEYFANEAFYLDRERSRVQIKKSTIAAELDKITHSLGLLSTPDSKKTNDDEIAVREAQKALLDINTERDEIIRKIARLEGLLEAKKSLSQTKENTEDLLISQSEVRKMLDEVSSSIDEAIQRQSREEIVEALLSLKNRLQSFVSSGENTNTKNNDLIEEIKILEISYDELSVLEKNLSEERSKKESILEEARNILRNKEREDREGEKERYELKQKETELIGARDILLVQEETLKSQEVSFQDELKEAEVLIGFGASAYDPSIGREVSRIDQEDVRRRIERLKIKIEDVGGGAGGDILKEYEETVSRDQFLAKELADLESSILELKTLIRDLRDTLDEEFNSGIEKINEQFQKFFALMFGGGTAFLRIMVEHKGVRESEDEYKEEVVGEDSSSELLFERGIEINVALPHKKVKDLHMLSGGERSLTSIALLFAMSQVNPPPFLVLDETDAALDEANSRKYGDMIESLAKYSQLIVVTHNRETMSRANILYGVTIGSDGGSKLLSIKFDEALKVAK